MSTHPENSLNYFEGQYNSTKWYPTLFLNYFKYHFIIINEYKTFVIIIYKAILLIYMAKWI